MTSRKMLATAIAVAAICTISIPATLSAAAPNITYTASGTFATTPTSGSDQLKLAGEPFSVTIVVSAATVPYKTGPNWCAYNALKLTGTVHSGLVGPSPVSIGSAEASIIQATDAPSYDLFTMEAPIKVVEISLTIKAQIELPNATIKNGLLYPFGSVALAPGNATLSYAEGTESTVLPIQTGTLTATIPGPSTTAAVQLHSTGIQAITQHGDGTQTVQSAASGISFGTSADTVNLKLYAAGVSSASNVEVKVAGQTVPVLYAGASGYYAGMDELVVQLPRSLAGMGDVVVSLTADGQSAAPVHIHLQ
ncbi:MAG TPA: hypothetical protein VMU80_09750 [Bryobacteraceae bacterium]|nr:hypothetical protein [Bryobacteraceae bacterium]